MWSYNKQIVIRWLSFALGALALGAIFAIVSPKNPEIFTQIGLKAEITKLSVGLEFLPNYYWAILFALINIAFILGVPSVLVFAMLYPLIGFLSSFAIVFLCQVFTSFIAMLLAWRRIDKARIHPTIKSLLGQHKDFFTSFAFWSRLYYSYPLRTIDMLTPAIHPDDQPVTSTVYPAATAIFLRMIIPSFWCESLIVLIKNISSNPGADSARFLFWSSAIVAYTMIPRVPELFICPDNIKSILNKIETAQEIKDEPLDSLEGLNIKQPLNKSKPGKPIIKKPEKQPEPQTAG